MLNTLRSLLISELRDLHSAETQLRDLLAEVVVVAKSHELIALLQKILTTAENRIGDLEFACSLLSADPLGRICHGMHGLIMECQEHSMEIGPFEVRDVSLVGCCLRIVHYRIAGLKSALFIAREIENTELSALLEQQLNLDLGHEEDLLKLLKGGFLRKGLTKLAAG